MGPTRAKDQILDGLVELIADAVVSRLAAGDQRAKVRLLDVVTAAEYIGRSPAALRHMIAKGAIPCVRRDGRVQLDRQDLDAWVEMGKARG